MGQWNPQATHGLDATCDGIPEGLHLGSLHWCWFARSALCRYRLTSIDVNMYESYEVV